MSFWMVPEPDEPDEELDEDEYTENDDETEIGVSVPLRFELARTPAVVIVVDRVVAFGASFTLTLSIRCRTWRANLHDSLFMGFTGFQAVDDDDLFRFGVEFADGRRATTVGSHADYDEDSDAAVIFGRSVTDTDDGRGWDHVYIVGPLPPPGPLTFACEWPVEGIPVTRFQVDAAPILEAAARSEPIWPEP
jgi:hypothetical protein